MRKTNNRPARRGEGLAVPARRCWLLHGASAALALASAPSIAQTESTSGVGGVTDDDIDLIVVTAKSLETTLPIELAEFGSDVEFVTEEEIDNHGFVDVSQSLEMLVPGLYLTTQAGAFSYVDLSLQGSRTADVLWTMDGVRINNRLYNSTSPADTLPAGMIERTEVLNGGQGLLYGTQAAAGVINVVTRTFSEETEGSVTVGMDDNSGRHINGYIGGAAGNHNFVGWFSEDDTEGYQIYDVYQPSASVRDRGYDVSSYGVKYGYDFASDLQLSVQALHTEAVLGYPSVSGGNVNDRDEEIVSLRLDYTPNDGAQFFVKGYVHDWDTLYYPPPKPADPPFWGYNDRGLGSGARFFPEESPLEYLVGFDLQKYDGRDEVLLIDSQEEEVKAVYGQIRTTDLFSERTKLTFGMRYNDTGGATATVGSISGVHHLSDYLYVEGVLGTSFLLPDAFSLYNIDTCCAFGNPNLEPEESTSLNLAVGGRLDVGDRPLSWQITTWDRTIDNLISSTTADMSPIAVPPEYDRVRINVDGEVEARGAEFLLRGPITPTLSFSINFSYSEEETQSGQQIPGRPKQNQKASLSYDAPSGRYGLSFAVKHVGTTNTDVNGFDEQQYGDYYVSNLGIRLFLDEARNHRLNLRLENAFDEDYATSVRSTLHEVTADRFMYRRLGPPQTVYFNYTYTF